MWSVAIVDHAGSVVEVLCQGETRLSGATSFAAGFGQSAKGAVVVMTDAALGEIRDAGRVTRSTAINELERTESTRQSTHDRPGTRLTSHSSEHKDQAQSHTTDDRRTIECILRVALAALRTAGGMQLEASAWDVYAFDDDGISKINDAPMCEDAAEYFRSLLDTSLFHASLLWPASVAMQSLFRPENDQKTRNTTLPTIGASEGKQVCCTS